MSRELKRVYIIAGDDGTVKVGISKHPDIRAAELFGSNWVVWQTEAHPQARLIEAAAHQKLLRFRVKREWFQVTAEFAASVIEQAMHEVATGALPAVQRLPHENAPAQKTDSQIGISLSPEIKLALGRAAAHERRTMSSLIGKVMADWLIEAGHLPLAVRRLP